MFNIRSTLMAPFDTLVCGKILLMRNFEKTWVLGQNCDALAYFCLGYVPFSFSHVKIFRSGLWCCCIFCLGFVQYSFFSYHSFWARIVMLLHIFVLTPGYHIVCSLVSFYTHQSWIFKDDKVKGWSLEDEKLHTSSGYSSRMTFLFGA